MVQLLRLRGVKPELSSGLLLIEVCMFLAAITLTVSFDYHGLGNVNATVVTLKHVLSLRLLCDFVRFFIARKQTLEQPQKENDYEEQG